jgi:hypothetical protein
MVGEKISVQLQLDHGGQKPAVNVAVEIIDFSRLFLQITLERVSGTVQESN